MSNRSESGAVSGWMVVAILLVVALVVVPLMGRAFGGGTNPEDWLREHYAHVSGEDPENGGVVFHSDDDPAQTADDIEAGTGPDNVRTSDSNHYLRYDDDWMVVVSEDAVSGSEIVFYEFDEGYRLHGPVVLFWGSFYNRGGTGGGGLFRGGGSGFGK